MAQVRKYQNSGAIPEPQKIRVNLDGTIVELTEEELDQVYANAFNSIKTTGSVGPGDEANWAKRYITFKDLAKSGTFNFDTNPDQTLNVGYAGSSAPEEDLGLKHNKTRRVTAFGKLFGGVDSPDRQTSEIHYYMGSALRKFFADKNQAQRKAEEDALKQSEADADQWATKFNSNFGLGRSQFGKEYNTQDASLLLKPYWSMASDEERVSWLQPKVFQALSPLFQLDPTTDALKIKALEKKIDGFNFDDLRSKFQEYYDQENSTAKLGQLQDLWKYANAQDSTKEDIYFWDKDAFDKIKFKSDDDQLFERLKDQYDPETGSPEEAQGTTPPLQNDIDPDIGVSNPYGKTLPADLYKLRNIKFFVNNTPVSLKNYSYYVNTMADTNPKKKRMKEFLDQFSDQYDLAYDYHMNTGWQINDLNPAALAPNSVIHQLFGNLKQGDKVYYAGSEGDLHVFQTVGSTISDFEGKYLPNIVVYDEKTKKVYKLNANQISWDSEKENYKVQLEKDKALNLSELQRITGKEINDILLKLGKVSAQKQLFHKSQKGSVIRLKSEDQLLNLTQNLASLKQIDGTEAAKIVSDWRNAGKIVIANPAQPASPQQSEEVDLPYTIVDENVYGEHLKPENNKLSRWGQTRVSDQVTNSENLSPADIADISSIILDLTSFIPGFVGAGQGLGSAVQSTYSNIVRDGFQGSDLAWGQLDQGLAALAFFPGGATLKFPRMAAKLAKLKGLFMSLQTGLIGLGAYNQAQTIEKMYSQGVDSLDLTDIRNLVSGFQAFRQGRQLTKQTRGLAHQKLPKGEQIVNAKIIDKNGKPISHKLKLTKEEVELIKSADDQELALKEFIRSRSKVDAELQGRIQNRIGTPELELNDIEIPMSSKYSIKRPFKNRTSIGVRDQVDFETGKTLFVKNYMDEPNTLRARQMSVLYGNPVQGRHQIASNPEVRSIAVPVDKATLRPRVKLVDGKFVDDVGYESLVQLDRPHFREQLANNKKGVEVLKQFNKVGDIDKQLTTMLVDQKSPEDLQKQRRLLSKLGIIDSNVSKASVIAKDPTMQQDISDARKSILDVMKKHSNKVLQIQQGMFQNSPKALGPKVTQPPTKLELARERLRQASELASSGSVYTTSVRPKGLLNPSKLDVTRARANKLSVRRSSGQTIFAHQNQPKMLGEAKITKKQNELLNKGMLASSGKVYTTPTSGKSTPITPITKRVGSGKQLELDFSAKKSKAPKKTTTKKATPAKKTTTTKKKTNKPSSKAIGGILIPKQQFGMPGITLKKLLEQINTYTQNLTDFKQATSPSAQNLSRYNSEGELNVNPEERTFTERYKSLLNGKTNPNTTVGSQSGITPKLPEIKLDEAWALKGASTLQQIKALNRQDTRFTPTIQSPTSLPLSTISGTQLLENQYQENAAKAESQFSQPKTSDAHLNTQAGLALQQNLGTHRSEGQLKAQQMRDQLQEKQTAQIAANINQSNQQGLANSAELAKMANAVRTNKNYIIRNKAELASGYMGDYASYMLQERSKREQLENVLASQQINRYFDDMFSNEFDKLTELDQKRFTTGLTPEERAQYDNLTKAMNKVRQAISEATLNYQLHRNPLDLESKYPREHFII